MNMIRVAAVLAMCALAGCASAKMETVDANETAIDFAKRMKVSFANKLDKLIEQATLGDKQDKGDHFLYSFAFFPVEAGELGVKAAFENLCRRKQGQPEGSAGGRMHCMRTDGSSIFAVDVQSRQVSGTRTPKVSVAVWEPKDGRSATLEAMRADGKAKLAATNKALEQANQQRQNQEAALRLSAESKGYKLEQVYQYCIQYGIASRPASNLERASGSVGYQIDRHNAYLLCMMQHGFSRDEANEIARMAPR